MSQDTLRRRKRFIENQRSIKIAVFLLILVSVIGLAPFYLLVSEEPAESGAVVLFVGPGNSERLGRAEQIIKDVLSKYLLIPAFSKIIKIGEDEDFESIRFLDYSSAYRRHFDAGNKIARQIEDTHREVLRARKMMEHLSLTSANFVSSPYHLRRIKIIAGRVFDNKKYRITFVAAGKPAEKPYLWFTSSDCVWWITREYAKIIWFLIYEPFLKM